MRYRLRDLLSFKKPEGPPVPISSDFYMSVLASNAISPSLNQLMNPKGEGGAIVGLSVPLKQNSQKEDLSIPIGRGLYALSSLDKKTVLKLRAFAHEEAQFNPESVLSLPAFQSMDTEIVQRIRATWTIYQLTFESYEPSLFPSLNFFINTAVRLGYLTEGAIADPLAVRYLLPQHFDLTHDQGFHIQNFVAIAQQEMADGFQIATRGLVKFDQREIEISQVGAEKVSVAKQLLLSVANGIVEGHTLELGDKLISEDGWVVTDGSNPLSFELMPMKGDANSALSVWKQSHE